MGLLRLLMHDPLIFLVVAPALLYSIIFHEVAHGAAAYFFGDDTAQRHGRLTLNPLAHLDPLGTLMLLLVGFGWAKPVPVNYAVFRNSRFGLIVVSLAGCATNILIAAVSLFILQFPSVNEHYAYATMLSIVAQINIILGAFNLIPIPPLDGSRLLTAVLPAQARYRLAMLEPYGMFIIVILLFSGALGPVIRFIEGGILGVIGALFHLLH